MTHQKIVGSCGEGAVVAYLVDRQYTIIARNVRYRGGEIDIIARSQDTIAFIEVKTRTSHYFHLSSVITPQKQKCIIRAAHQYLSTHDIHESIIRFDVALVESQDGHWEITYYPNAFTDHQSMR